MTTIRSFIQHHRQFDKIKDHYTNRYNATRSLPMPQRKLSHHQTSKTTGIISPLFPHKKCSLPSIGESSPKIKPFSLEAKRREAIDEYFQCKNQSIVSKNRYKTQQSERKRQKCSHKNIVSNLQEIRMTPIDRYFYKMQNIRLAQRLLIAKPSPQLSRNNQKKFYKQQKHYSSRISHTSHTIKNKKCKKDKLTSKWLQ